MTARTTVAAAAAALVMGAAAPAMAQDGPVRVRGSVGTGVSLFAADQSFEAIVGERSGHVWGGGVEAVLVNRVTIGVRASRFSAGGQRVFPFQGRIFPLAVPTSITLTPVELSVAYRFTRGDVVPYAGAGVGWHRYRETAPVADPGESVDTTFRGYHVVGGAELRIASWLGLAGEGQWTRVPDALTGGLAEAFDEGDLGGATFRVRIIVGP